MTVMCDLVVNMNCFMGCMFPQEIVIASPVEIFLKVSASAALPPSVIHILSNSYVHRSKSVVSGMVAVKHERESLHLFCSVQHLV